MNILITGASGYIGRSLHEALKSKHNVTAIKRENLDLTNQSAVRSYLSKRWYDAVLHCAVKGGSRLREDDWSVLDDNLSMYYNLLHNRSSYKKLIHFGSGAELFAQDTPYGYSKSVIRRSILSNDDFYNIRIFAAFDHNELDSRFIKSNIKRYIKKEPMIVHKNKVMDFMYMPDLVKIVEHYINNEGPKEINCNYKQHSTLLDIAKIINSLDSHEVEIITQEQGLDESYSESHTDLQLELTGLNQGIINTYKKIK